MQNFGKAYPGLRQLEVIRALGNRGLPASICPRDTSLEPADPGFGYNPAVDAIIRRSQGGFGPSCVDRLDSDVTSSLSCRVLEVGSGSCDCAQPGRRAIDDSIASDVATELAALCFAEGGNCQDCCACEVVPVSGAALDDCLNSETPSGDGWCYVSPSQSLGREDFIEHCPPERPQVVRVVGAPAAVNSASELRLWCPTP